MSKLIQDGKTTDVITNWKPCELVDQDGLNPFQFHNLDGEDNDGSFSENHNSNQKDVTDFQPIVFPMEQLKKEATRNYGTISAHLELLSSTPKLL